jgi:hypothetical protein
MTTINNVPNDVIAKMALSLPLADRNSLMRTSKAFMAACQSDPVWLPMVRALFLMKKQGATCYEIVKRFYESFTYWTNHILVPAAPKGAFARIGSLFWSSPKEIPFETNRKRLQNPNVGQELVPAYRTFECGILARDIEVAFHLYQTVPGFLQTGELIERAMAEGNWPMARELANTNENLQAVIASRLPPTLEEAAKIPPAPQTTPNASAPFLLPHEIETESLRPLPSAPPKEPESTSVGI